MVKRPRETEKCPQTPCNAKLACQPSSSAHLLSLRQGGVQVWGAWGAADSPVAAICLLKEAWQEHMAGVTCCCSLFVVLVCCFFAWGGGGLGCQARAFGIVLLFPRTQRH